MFSKLKNVHLECFAVLLLGIAYSFPALSQTLGGIAGTVTDTTGSTIADTNVTAVEGGTGLTRTASTNSSGEYAFVNMPIGSYTVTFTREGFDTQKSPGINVQAERTVTLNVSLKVGSVNTSVEVDATPLMNASDTTNGYVLDKPQIDAIPLATGSFTGLAILSPGVSAELSGGTGSNSGLGNAPIWANGQRDTSNSFLLNGVDSSNLFNGKSTSQVASARIVNSTGNGTPHAGGVIQSSSSIYLSIGNAIPSPAPETLSEVRVNASMYDAQQGSSSGAHIDMSTASGTNEYHGTAYVHRGTNWINAAPFFFNQDPNIPANMKVPQLHRYLAGGSFGGPIIKNKLFGFLAYQHLHTSDQEIGSSFFSVPVGLSDDRSAGGLAAVANNGWGGNYSQPITGANISPVAQYLMNLPALPGQPGKWLVPNDDGTSLTVQHYDNAFVPGTAYFIADQAVADLDWNATQKDTVAFKYYYQHDPTVAPYAYSSVPGFSQHLDTGAQVGSVSNTLILKSNLSTTQTFGFIREKIYSTNTQAITAQDAGINEFGSSYFPGIAIVDPLGTNKPTGAQNPITSIGLDPNAQASLTGVFQNRWMPSANAIWSLGKHTLTFGGSYEYTQLNARDRRTGSGTIATSDFSQFVQGLVTTNDDFRVTTYLQGDANRYYRANQTGFYLQDKYLIRSNLSLTAGVRYDWNGGLTEKYGRIFNFDPSLYSYSSTSDTISNNGFIIAGNNAEGTKGVSNTTLTGRQWGIGPRLGFAWTPKQNDGKVVFRGGTGIYYDRGELYTYFSPGYAIGAVTGGPFGVSQSPPFVNSQTCASSTMSFYLGYIPTCDPAVGNLGNPWGAELGPPPTGKAQDITNYLPNAAAILAGQAPYSIGVYDRRNKLPYSINYTLDMQWQPRNDLAIDIGYVGTVSRHQVIPVPLNQPNIASPSNGVNCPGPACQHYTYGYTLKDGNFNSQLLPDGTTYLSNYEGGNVDLRVPYIGYAAESIDYKAAGVASYNALQVHVEKRMSHGLQVGLSYTYSHATDEQSAMGLFYNGNNPLNLRSGYGSSDFDRTHVVNFNYVYQFPDFFARSSIEGKLANGWAIEGLTVIQSGQPFSVIDYTGAVGSIYYSVYDGITNPIVPLANGCDARAATTGASGAFTAGSGQPFLKATCFGVPLLGPGALGGAIPDGSNNSVADPYETNFTTGQRNIFRQAYQRRADISLVKNTQLTERYGLRYTFDVFNLTNTTSFDVTGDNVSQNQYYDQYPVVGTTPLPTGCDINGNQTNSSFYNCPTGLGITTHAISSPRQIQMSLQLTF
jgi:hypothetical protein